MGLWKFLQYHNAVPIAFSIALLGAGGVFAASNPEVLYNAESRAVSVDNSYIAYKDLSSYSPTVSITGVTEDEEYYYVAYTFSTIDLAEYVWQDVVKKEVMKVSKADLGPYRDLGLYVTEQLKQKIDREIAYLKEVQDIEKKQLSQKMVATAYSGLIGQFLDESTEVLPNYTPVVVPPKPSEPEPVVAVSTPSENGTNSQSQQQGAEPGNTQPQSPEPPPQSTTQPIIAILGDNPARVPVGGSYTDLGAAITGPTDAERALTVHVFVNDVDVQSVSIDTSEPREWKISYKVFNGGVVTSKERTVVVYAPEPEPVPAPPETQSEDTPPEVVVPEGDASEETASAETPATTSETPSTAEAPVETPMPSTTGTEENVVADPPPSEESVIE